MNRTRLALAVLAAYCVGILIGNLLWTPVTGALFIAFTAGALILALPLLGIAILIATLAQPAILKRPALWSVAAATIAVAVYALVDSVIYDKASAERLGLASACAFAAAGVFHVLIRSRIMER